MPFQFHGAQVELSSAPGCANGDIGRHADGTWQVLVSQPPAAGKTGRKPITRPGMTSLPKASGLQVHLGMVNGSWKSHCELFRQIRYAVMHTLAVLKHVQPVSCLENWLRTNMECDHPQDIG